MASGFKRSNIRTSQKAPKALPIAVVPSLTKESERWAITHATATRRSPSHLAFRSGSKAVMLSKADICGIRRNSRNTPPLRRPLVRFTAAARENPSSGKLQLSNSSNVRCPVRHEATALRWCLRINERYFFRFRDRIAMIYLSGATWRARVNATRWKASQDGAEPDACRAVDGSQWA